MADPLITQLLALLTTGGLPGIVVLLIYGGMKRWYVFGWQYDDVTQRLRETQAKADLATEAALKNIERVAQLAKDLSGK